MRFSRMSPELRQQIIDLPENYPLLVSFLGKRGLLSFEEVDFLRRNGVDFDVDDNQANDILRELREEEEYLPQTGQGSSPLRPPPTITAAIHEKKETSTHRLEVLLAIGGILLAVFAFLRRFVPPFSKR